MTGASWPRWCVPRSGNRSHSWVLTLSTQVLFSVYCIAVIVISSRVLGTNGVMPGEVLVLAVMLLKVAEYFYIFAMMALKISLGIFFLRLAVVKWQRLLIHLTMGITVLFGIGAFLFAALNCGRYSSGEEYIRKRVRGECGSSASIFGVAYAHGALSTLTDFIFLAMPVLILRKSLMKREDKRSLIALLMFASAGCIASIVRFWFISGLGTEIRSFFAHAKNLGIWSCIEPGVGIAACSIATLQPLYKKLFPARCRSGGARGSSQLKDSQPRQFMLKQVNMELHFKVPSWTRERPPVAPKGLNPNKPLPPDPILTNSTQVGSEEAWLHDATTLSQTSSLSEELHSDPTATQIISEYAQGDDRSYETPRTYRTGARDGMSDGLPVTIFLEDGPESDLRSKKDQGGRT